MADLRTRLKTLERRRRSASSSTTSTGGRPLTGEELAERLGITGETVRRWAGLGMPSCGTHPARPSWPVYDEVACRGWAAANQPQTALRPPTGDAAGEAAPAEKETMADLRARRLYLQCRIMRHRLIEERGQLLEAGEARAVWRQHAVVVRQKLGAMPAQMAIDLAEAFGLGESTHGRFTAILAAEMARVTDMVSDDPLKDAAVIKEHSNAAST